MFKKLTALILAFILALPVAVFSASSTLKINPGYLKFEAEDFISEGNSSSVFVDGNNLLGKKGVILNNSEIFVDCTTTAPDNKIWLRYSSAEDDNYILYKTTDNEEFKKLYLTKTGDSKKFGWILITILPKPAVGVISLTLKSVGNAVLDTIVFSRKAQYYPPDEEELYEDIGEIIPQPNYGYPKPWISIPNEHPRVMFTSADIPRIKANIEKPQNIAAYENFRKLADTETDGMLDTSAATNHNTSILDIIQAKAFDYAVFGNKEHGLQAISAMENYLDTVSWADSNDANMTSYHYQTHCTFKTSVVYDWCYDLMDDDMRKKFVYRCQNMVSWCFCGWPLINNVRGAIIGEGCANAYLRDLLTFGIATYDEYPDIYDYVGSLILTNYIDVRDYFYQSHAQLQGSQYGYYVYYSDLWCQKLFEAISGKRVMSDDLYKTVYYFIYLQLPNEGLFRECDDYMYAVGTLVPPNYDQYSSFFSCVASDAMNDPYVKSYQKQVSENYTKFLTGTGEFTAVEHLIFNNPDIPDDKSYKDLSKSMYFPEPKGMILSRTSWDDGIGSSSALAMMKIGTKYFGYHQNNDAGSFQLYYKGALTEDLGQYARTDQPQYHAHSSNTIAHNCLLIYDPTEQFEPLNNYDININFGGQRRIGRTGNTLAEWMSMEDHDLGEVIGYEFGPDLITPEYSYIAGDIAKSYSSKAKEVKRHMIFMPEQSDDGEAVFFVFDKIKSSQPFKKTFLLQAWEEPEIHNNQIILRRTVDNYEGQLTEYVISPSDYVIDPIGGVDKQWFVNGKNYIPTLSYIPAYSDNPLAYGWGRIEICPESINEDDYFMNAMYLSDSVSADDAKKAEKIENDNVLGAALLSKAAVFAKGSKRASQDISFDIPSDRELDIAVANISQGEWTVSVDGKDLGQYISTKDGGMIYFKAKGKNVNIKLSDVAKTEKEFTSNEVTYKKNPLDLRVNSRLVYSNVSPEIIDDIKYIPLRSFCDYAKFDIVWNSDEKSVTVDRFGNMVKLYTNGDKAYVDNSEIQLTKPVMMKNGSMLISETAALSLLGANLEYIPAKNSINIVVNLKIQESSNPDLVPIIDAMWSENSAVSGYLSFDGSKDTRWYSSGENEWITYVLKNEDDIASFMFFPNTTKDRTYSFDMYSSVDGKEFTHFLEARTDGKGEPQIFNLAKPVRAKYIKIIGHGNSVTMWNNISEIEFFNRKQVVKED